MFELRGPSFGQPLCRIRKGSRPVLDSIVAARRMAPGQRAGHCDFGLEWRHHGLGDRRQLGWERAAINHG